MLVNYVSLKQTIGRFITDFGIDETSYIEEIAQWTEDAIQIIGIPNYYVYKFKNIPIENSRCAIPCDIENLHGIWVSKDLISRPCRNNLYKLDIKNAQMIGDNGVTTPSHRQAFGTINGNFLHTSFNKGNAFFAYTGIPMDCDGYPMVPKDAQLNQALQYWFIYRMSLSGFKHPVIDFNTAYQMWEKLYPAAGNSVNWMDLGDLQEFTEMWNNVLIGDMSDHYYIV